MNRIFLHTRRLLLGLLAAACLSHSANAQTLPSTINVLVPNVAGGTADILARIVGDALSKDTGINAVVQNVPGASGGIAQTKVITSAPDGSTLMLAGGSQVLLDVVKKTQKMHDLAPLAGVASLPMVLVGRPSLGAKTLDELVEFARTPGQELSIAAGGTGTLPHLGAILFKDAAKAPMIFVPYKGAPNMLPDLIGGHIDLAVLLLPAALSNIRNGSVRAYGLFSPNRSTIAPDVPSLLESNALRSIKLFSDYWSGVFISAQTPPELQARISSVLSKALANPEAQQKILDSGSVPMPLGADALITLMRTDEQSFQQIIAANKLKFD